MNCFCGMVDRRKEFSIISNRDHCQRSSPSLISDTPRAGFEPAQNLSSDFVEWICAVVIIEMFGNSKLLFSISILPLRDWNAEIFQTIWTSRISKIPLKKWLSLSTYNMAIKQQIGHGAIQKVYHLHNSIFHSIPFHSTCTTLCPFYSFPAGNYMFKVGNRNTRTRCEICSRLTIKIPERRHWLVFLLLTLSI